MKRVLTQSPQSTIDEGAKAVLHLVLDPEVGSGQFHVGLSPGRAHVQAMVTRGLGSSG